MVIQSHSSVLTATHPFYPMQADAEEVCTILQEAFQLVYTEATVQQLNESISAGEKGGGGTAMSSKRTQKPSKGV